MSNIPPEDSFQLLYNLVVDGKPFQQLSWVTTKEFKPNSILAKQRKEFIPMTLVPHDRIELP